MVVSTAEAAPLAVRADRNTATAVAIDEEGAGGNRLLHGQLLERAGWTKIDAVSHDSGTQFIFRTVVP